MDADPHQIVHQYQVHIYFADKSQSDLVIKAQQLGTPHLYEIVING
jgi:hypothetical protein